MDFLLDPNIAYFLLVAGFVMALLALFSPGTGILEIGALFMLALAGYGVVNLPLNLWALGLLVLGVFPFVLALRRSRRYIYLAIALAALIVGSTFLFRAPEGGTAVNPFLAILVSVLSFGLVWYIARSGLEAMQRPLSHAMKRFIGQEGQAETDILFEGTVYVGGEEWTARSSTLIPAGSRVRVTGREGLVLLVEPIAPQPAPTSPGMEG